MWGKPEPENIGSFWPRTNVFIPSILDIPVWINSDGSSREYGFIPDPTKSNFCFDTIVGPYLVGFPNPSKVLPSISSDTDNVAVSPMNFVKVPVVPSPIVDPKYLYYC